jgi:hypothetical protein
VTQRKSLLPLHSPFSPFSTPPSEKPQTPPSYFTPATFPLNPNYSSYHFSPPSTNTSPGSNANPNSRPVPVSLPIYYPVQDANGRPQYLATNHDPYSISVSSSSSGSSSPPRGIGGIGRRGSKSLSLSLGRKGSRELGVVEEEKGEL